MLDNRPDNMVVCEVIDGMPLHYVFDERAAGREPDPYYWEVDEERSIKLLPGERLTVTCPKCLECMHA